MCIIVFENAKKKKKGGESKQHFFPLPLVKSLCGITQSLLGCILCDVEMETGPLCAIRCGFQFCSSVRICSIVGFITFWGAKRAFSSRGGTNSNLSGRPVWGQDMRFGVIPSLVHSNQTILIDPVHWSLGWGARVTKPDKNDRADFTEF